MKYIINTVTDRRRAIAAICSYLNGMPFYIGDTPYTIKEITQKGPNKEAILIMDLKEQEQWIW